jgi:hypothetical protein
MTNGNDPTWPSDPVEVRDDRAGLSKREWLAGLAMMGLCPKRYDCQEIVAAEAVRLADALIAELNK